MGPALFFRTRGDVIFHMSSYFLVEKVPVSALMCQKREFTGELPEFSTGQVKIKTTVCEDFFLLFGTLALTCDSANLNGVHGTIRGA